MQESDVIVVVVAAVGRVYDKCTDTTADFIVMNSLLCPSSQVHKQVGCADSEYRPLGKQQYNKYNILQCLKSV